MKERVKPTNCLGLGFACFTFGNEPGSARPWALHPGHFSPVNERTLRHYLPPASVEPEKVPPEPASILEWRRNAEEMAGRESELREAAQLEVEGEDEEV